MTKREQFDIWGFYILEENVDRDFIEQTASKLVKDLYIVNKFSSGPIGRSPIMTHARYQAKAMFKNFTFSNIEN
jgi:hypothetical protein